MVEFLAQHKLYLTPLSPIHMGSGEDFELTNYVIKDGFLQLFDPSQLHLSAILRKQLLTLAERGLSSGSHGPSSGSSCNRYILDLRSWFKSHQDLIAKNAYHFVAVSQGFEAQYEKGLANLSEKTDALNQFKIERTEYNPVSGASYIPGSAFKGMIRTTWLEYLSAQNRSKIDGLRNRKEDYEKILLNMNSFDKDPFRLFKPADFIPTSDQVYTSIQYSINKYKKQPDDASKNPRGLSVPRESIVEGQYRAFMADCVIQQTEGKIPVAQLTMTQLAQKNNEYYQKRFRKECDLMMSRGFLDVAWYQSTQNLLASMELQLQTGQIMLVRLGKNTGAESKTDDQFASIKIMQAKKQPEKYEKQTKTLWLASKTNHATSHMLPFGWALVEIDPVEDLLALQTWCKDNQGWADIAEKLAALHQIQQEALAKAKAEEMAKQQAEEEKAQAEAMLAEKLANMSEAETVVHEILEIVKQPSLQPGNEAGQKALADVIEKLEFALTLAEQDQRIIGREIPFAVLKDIVSKKREKSVKPLLAKLRGEA